MVLGAFIGKRVGEQMHSCESESIVSHSTNEKSQASRSWMQRMYVS